VRLVFNAVGVRVFGAAYVGTVAAGLAYSSVAAVLLSAIPGVLGARFVSQYRGAGDMVGVSVAGGCDGDRSRAP